MKLIELYIQEVTRRIPEKNRADIALELRSTIEDMLPENYSEQDVKDVLGKLGSPAILASGYRDRPMHLIGPRYFDLYTNLLKMIIPIAALVSTIAAIVTHFVSNNGEEAILNIVIGLIGVVIANIITTSIQTFFWLTLLFAIIERVDIKENQSQSPITENYKEWTPDDLKHTPYIVKEKVISKIEVFCSLLWTAIWASGYFFASKLVGVYQSGSNGLEFVTPTFNQDVLLSYWPLVTLVIVLEVVLAIYKYIKTQWTMKLAIFNGVYQIISTIILIVVLSNPNLFHPSFVSYMTNLFEGTENFRTSLVAGVVLVFVIIGAVDAYKGLRKAKINHGDEYIQS